MFHIFEHIPQAYTGSYVFSKHFQNYIGSLKRGKREREKKIYQKYNSISSSPIFPKQNFLKGIAKFRIENSIDDGI